MYTQYTRAVSKVQKSVWINAGIVVAILANITRADLHEVSHKNVIKSKKHESPMATRVSFFDIDF
jgi:hypothetical protein